MPQPISPSLEDYLETILHLSQEGKTAKISDIALTMNIAKPSVTQAINALQKSGLVLHEPYGPVLLTEAGEEKAHQIWQRHQMLYKFLRDILQVSPATAEADACRMEHVISSETFRKIEHYMENNSPGKEDS